MAYNRNIPAATDLISNSQSAIQGNFQTIDSASNPATPGIGVGFDRNHVTMTDATNGGLHNRIDFYQNIATPSISGAFVSSLYPVAAASELQYTNAGGTTQITSAGLAIWKGGTGTGVVTDTNAATGALNLPNGIQFRWGAVTADISGTPTTFSSPFSNGVYTINLTPISSSSKGASLNTQSANGFTAYSVANGTSMYYFAVGH